MRYWIYMNGEVPGSYEPAQLAVLPGFTMTTLVCPAQGEIAEKNWRRAGEFDEIAAAVSSHIEKTPPPAPPPAGAASSSSSDVDSMLDTASNRLFSHVADLMKELENRREERALSGSLQRQITALKEELGQARERANMLEMRLPRIAELEETLRKDGNAHRTLQESVQAREQALSEAHATAEKMKNEAETAKRRLLETQNDLTLRNLLVDKLSKELNDKELSLAKSLGLIRRLEEDLNRLCPEAVQGTAAAGVVSSPSLPPIKIASVPPENLTEEPTPPTEMKSAGESTVFTTDEPPPTPPYLEPSSGDRPNAQQALVNFFKKVFPSRPH